MNPNRKNFLATLLFVLVIVGSGYTAIANANLFVDLTVFVDKKLKADSNNQIECYAYKRGTKSPIANQEVLLLRQNQGEFELVEKATTNAEGYVKFNVKFNVKKPRDKSNNLLTWQIKTQGMFYDSQLTFQQRRQKSKSSLRSLLSLDKTLYQPGHTVNVKALVRNANNEPQKNEVLIVQLQNFDKQVLHKETATTDKFGLMTMPIKLGQRTEAGSYEVRVKSKKTNCLLAKQRFKVDRYRLPNFSCKLSTHTNFVLPGRSLKVQIQSQRFDRQAMGEVLASLKLKSSLGTLILAKKLRLATGSGIAEVEIPEDIELGPNGETKAFVELECIDKAGELSQSAAVVYIVRKPLRIAAFVQSGQFIEGMGNNIVVALSKPGGQPIQGQIAVNYDSKANNAQPIEKLSTDRYGLAYLKINSKSELKSVTAWTRSSDFGLSGPEKPIVFTRAIEFTEAAEALGKLYSSKHKIKAGEDIRLNFTLNPKLKSLASQSLPVTIEHETAVIQSKSLKLSKTTGSLDLNISKPGLYKAWIYGLAGQRTYSTALSLLVLPKEPLALTINTNKSYFRPGETVKLSASIQSKEPSGVNIQVVDQALSALNGLFPQVNAVEEFLYGKIAASDRRRRGFAQAPLPQNITNPEEQNRSATIFRKVSQPALKCLHSNEMINESRILQQQQRYLTWIWLIVETLAIILLLGFIGYKAYQITVKYPVQVTSLLLFLLVTGCCLTFLAPSTLSASRRANHVKVGSSMQDLSEAMSVLQERQGLQVPSIQEEKRESQSKAKRRVDFPETLAYFPVLIFDSSGQAHCEFQMADSLTSWQIDALACTESGGLDAASTTIVSQLPLTLDVIAPAICRQNDSCEIVVSLRNNSKNTWQGQLQPNFPDSITVLDASNVNSEIIVEKQASQQLIFRLKFNKIGQFNLDFTAIPSNQSSKLSDSIQWPIQVKSAGFAYVESKQITIDRGLRTQQIQYRWPEDDYPEARTVTINSTSLSSEILLEGLENLIREPSGCFEQTSSTTYPNALIAQYFANKQSRSATKYLARAKAMAQKGYQRLTGFEVDGGGFSLYGKSPASVWLSAYGLKEFVELSKVVNVDTQIIRRTADYLKSKQAEDGSYQSDSYYARLNQSEGKVKMTAYVLKVLCSANMLKSNQDKAAQFLLRRADLVLQRAQAQECLDVANALLKWNTADPRVLSFVESVLPIVQVEPEVTKQNRNVFTGAYGLPLLTEFRAKKLAFLDAFQKVAANKDLSTQCQQIVSQLMTARNGAGYWYSTYTNIVVLETLLARISQLQFTTASVRLNQENQKTQEFELTEDRHSALLRPEATQAMNSLNLETDTAKKQSLKINYRTMLSWSEWQKKQKPNKNCKISIEYPEQDLKKNQEFTASIRFQNAGSEVMTSPLIVINLPTGVTLSQENVLKQAILKAEISLYEVTREKIVLYLPDYPAGKILNLNLQLRPKFRGSIQSGAIVAYPYYNPSDRTITKPTKLTVK